jgi:hypothetical protein
MDTVETGTLLINTVEDNRLSYTNRAYFCALLARRIQKTIGRPSNPTDTNNDDGSDDDMHNDTHAAAIDYVNTAGVIDDEEIVDGNEEVNEVDVINEENEDEDEENAAGGGENKENGQEGKKNAADGGDENDEEIVDENDEEIVDETEENAAGGGEDEENEQETDEIAAENENTEAKMDQRYGHRTHRTDAHNL